MTPRTTLEAGAGPIVTPPDAPPARRTLPSSTFVTPSVSAILRMSSFFPLNANAEVRAITDEPLPHERIGLPGVYIDRVVAVPA